MGQVGQEAALGRGQVVAEAEDLRDVLGGLMIFGDRSVGAEAVVRY